jgi:Sulfotransferase domain
MELQVIGAGFGRTGTWSTKAALDQLGFPCYHMSEILSNKENKSHLNFWRKVANSPPGAQQNWSQVFAKYQATVDNPGCCVWRELLAAYPDAKVLLTLHPRGAEAWYDSTMDTIYFSENMWQFKVLEWLTPFGRKFGDMAHKLIWQRSLQGTMTDKTKAIARYEAYVDEVKAAVPADKLLVFKVDQGWAPLCAFLGVPQPQTEFPTLNDRAHVKKAIQGVINGTYVTLAGYAAVVALLLYGAYRLLQ